MEISLSSPIHSIFSTEVYIGGGRSARVYRTALCNELIVTKRFYDSSEVEREAANLQKVSECSNIVKFHGVVLDDRYHKSGILDVLHEWNSPRIHADLDLGKTAMDEQT